MVADAVAAAKFPVGVVIGHAPAKAAGHALLRNGIVDPGGIAQSLHQPVGLVVKGLGGQLLPAEFADEVALAGIGSHRGAGFAGGTAPTVRVIVVGVNILQQLALAVVPRESSPYAAVKPEIKINRDYFEQQGISFEEPEEEQPEEKTEKAAPEISVNLDSEYFKWKEQEGKEEDSEDEKQPEKKGFFGKFMK